ncbi:MAG TPA: preprotein translocase subunit SecG [Rudaea sp.]|jgi:preprotein translocase subunit SecG|nr:preprotein translocase subunit SecG [Rudaea sp.]
MFLTLFNVIYVLIAVAMIALILLQRGAGAQAGSGFGGGASATVFGARGASNFLSRSTAVLAGVFFLLSLVMGVYLHPVATKPEADLGVMSGYQTPDTTKPAAPASSDVPAATSAPAANGDKPAPTTAAPAPAAVPAPATAAPAESTPVPAATRTPPVATDKKSDSKKKGGTKPADKNSH